MRRLLAAALLLLPITAWGQTYSGGGGGGAAGGMATNASNAAKPASWRNLGLGTDVELAPATVLVSVAGSSYVTGDVVTLTCSGVTASTTPLVAVSQVGGGGAVQKVTFVPASGSGQNKGTFTSIPTGGTTTCTGSGGSGTGLTITANFQPKTQTYVERLAAAGGSGNLWITSPEGGPYTGLYGTENLGIGFWSGACLTATSQGNVMIGGGWFGGGTGCAGGTLESSFNTVVGDDAMYNTVTVSGHTGGDSVFGQNAGRTLQGKNWSIFGQGACSPAGVANTPNFTGDWGICIGNQTGQAITSASEFLIMGTLGVGSTTFASGSHVILIGTSNAVDTPAGGTSNYLNIEGVLTTTGTNSPSTSASKFAGTLQAGGATGLNFQAGDGTHTFGTYSAGAGTGVQAGSVSNDNFGFYTNNGNVQVALLTNNILGFGNNVSASSSFAGLINSSGTLLVRKADNSADGPFSAGDVTFSGAMKAPGLANTSAAQTGTLCWVSPTGNVTVDTTTTCLASSMRFKHDWKPIVPQAALDEVMHYKPGTFFYNADLKIPGRQMGFTAEDMDQIDKDLVVYDDEGKPLKIRTLGIIAKLTAALQAQQLEIAELRKHIH